MKNVLIISSTPRKDGNSELICKQFYKGASDAGHKAEIVRLNDMKLGYCQGCYACTKLGHCFQNDGMNEISEKVLKADVIVFATPVYFYSMSGQLKVFIDRLVPIYTEVSADIYIFATAWDPDTSNLQSTVEAIRGCTRDCFENCAEKGVLIVGDVSEKGAIAGRSELDQAYDMGKNC